MFTFLNHGAKLTRIPSGIIAITTLAVLAAVIATLTLGSFTAQAQEPAGSINNQMVSSPDPGQLVVTWDSPTQTPTDYRVRWAPANQEYLSYSVENTSERGSAYPEATTLTVDNLPAGTEYKLQVRARYYEGQHQDNPWSGPWSEEATITVSSETTPTPEPTEEPTPEPASDVVNGLAMSSHAVGELVLTWHQPSDQPDDYRISWAPADEDYLSYSEENTSRRGNSYPDGSATSLTLTGLPGGVNYKVIMRARYQDSSGPWTDEVTQRIHNNPPAAPTSLNAAEVSDSSVTLNWTAPSSAGITGYRVLRGLTAAKQDVLANNTGSTETEYVDADVEAGTEYHYSVRAINDAGVSPSSNSIAVTAGDGQATSPRQDVNTQPSYPDTDGTFGADPKIFNVAENAVAGTVVGDASTTDADGDTLEYLVLGADLTPFNAAFSFDTATAVITVKAGTTLDYETKSSYAITVYVNDGEDSSGIMESSPVSDDSVPVTINVTDVDETATVTFTPNEPQLGIPITAAVTDTDGAVTAATWQWSNSDTATGTFTDITDATNATYRPAEADLGKFLKASVSYTDPLDSGNSASATTSSTVQVRDTILVDNLSDAEIARGNPGLSQGLTTGGHPEGYKISGVTISTSSSQSSLVVKIFSSTTHTNHIDRAAASELYELTYRSKSGSYHQTWDLPTGTRLDPNTTYHVVFLPANGRSRITCLGPASATSSGATDWSVISTIRSTTATGGDQLTLISGTCSLRIRGEAAKDGPHITDLSYSTEPTQTRTYDTGDTIKVAATFSEAVTVSTTNPPTLPLKIGSETRSATYVSSESTTTKLVFSYTVLATDQDDDGITIEQNSLTGGITRLSSTVAADLDHNADSNNTDRLVNAVPTVTSVRITSSPVAPNWYTTGETIEITVTFSMPITVTGNPVFRFALSIPGMTSNEDRSATYTASASETNNMVFRYTVLATDEDTNGIWLGDINRTFLLGADDSIKDGLRTTGNKDAVLTHQKLGTQGGHRVSPLPRLALRVTSDPKSGSGSDTYGVGEKIEFTATFNQDITVTGDPQHAFSLLDDGGNTATERRVADYQASLSGTRTAVFTYTVVAADRDNNGIFLWGHGGGNTSFDLDSDDTIQNSANADAVLDYDRHRTQSGHKVDGSLTPPITSPFNPPAFAVDSIEFNLAENTAGRVTLGTVVATDADGDTVYYVLGGPDAAAFTSETSLSQPGASIILQVFTTVDYETKQSYSLILSVTDREDEDGNPQTNHTVDDTVQITVNVLNVEEPGRLVINPVSLEQGINATASLTDPDGSLSNINWQWSRSDSGTGPFSDITEENGPNYVPVLPDKNKFLRIRVSYDDGYSTGNSHELITYVYAGTTTAEPTPVDFPRTGRTMGALRVGETSTGRLDPVDDNLHAPEHAARIPRGDMFRIEGLTAGNSYRVRAWFGTSKADSETSERGGDIHLYAGRGNPDNIYSLGQYYDDLLEDGLATFAFPAHANEDYYLSVIAPAFRYNSPAIPAYDYYGAYMLEIYDLGPTQTQSQPEGYGIKASNICVNNRCFNDPRFPEFWDDDHLTSETHEVSVGHDPTSKDLIQAVAFRAGSSTSPTASFKLDRIGAFVHAMTGGSIAQAAIHASTSSGPGAKLFDLDPILNDEENVDYFVASRDAQALSKNTKYYVVFSEGGGDNDSYKLHVTAKTTEDTQADSGWPIDDAGFTKDAAAGTPTWGGMKSGDSSSGASVMAQIRVYAGVAP